MRKYFTSTRTNANRLRYVIKRAHQIIQLYNSWSKSFYILHRDEFDKTKTFQKGGIKKSNLL